MSRGINIKDVINIESFQKIQNDIAKATGVAIITTDYKGKPVTEHSSCTEFCKIIRSKENLKELCEKCDSRGGLEAAEKAIDAMFKLAEDIGIPRRLRDVGVKEEDFEYMAGNALKDGNAFSNPRKGTEEDIVNIFKAAY